LRECWYFDIHFAKDRFDVREGAELINCRIVDGGTLSHAKDTERVGFGDDFQLVDRKRTKKLTDDFLYAKPQRDKEHEKGNPNHDPKTAHEQISEIPDEVEPK
jgi:hypothetical protein